MSVRLKEILYVLILALVYLAASRLGFSLAYVNASATAVWPPAGVALAALLLFGRKLWPGVLLGAFLANFAVQGRITNDLLVAIGNTIEAVLGAWLVARFARGVNFAEQAESVLKFIVLACFLSTAVSATIGVTSLCLNQEAAWAEYAKIWATWWLGDMMSDLMIAPLLIIWHARPAWRGRQAVEAVLCLAAVFAVGLFIFAPRSTAFPIAQYKYLSFLPVLWAAFRFGPQGAITSSVLAAGLALTVTLEHRGPFAGFNPNSALLFLQTYAGALTITGLVIGGVVAERTAAEERLEYALRAACNSEERERARAIELQTIMQAVPAVIWIAQDPECRVIKGNPASYEMLRLPGESNASKSADVKVRPTNFESFSQGLPLPPEQLPVQRAARGEDVRNFEEEIRFMDGTALFLFGNASPLRDANGKVTGAVAAFVDITARKKAEETLRAREAELETIINRTPFMLTRCSREFKYRFVSRAYSEMLNRPSEEITGRPIVEIMGEQGFATIRPHMERVLQGNRVEYEEAVLFRGVGVRVLHVIYSPERDDYGQVTGWIASILDVTERRAAESALQHAQSKLAEHAANLEKTVAERTARLRETVNELQTLSYSIAHDMRAPLRAMSAFAELLLEESASLSAEGQDYSRRIIAGADRLDRLIQDALNYTKTVLQELPLEPVDLAKLLRGLIDTYPNFHPENAGIEIAPDLPVVLGNEGLLTQCFANLLGNAVKFVARGTKPMIRVSVEKRAHDATISVQDNGIGIRKEHQGRLFGMFQKLDHSYEGTGIGLAIVRKVVERMNGQVGLESEADIGSRFWVTLPLAPETTNS